MPRQSRKAIYIPEYLWTLLDADSRNQLENVTFVLKNILLKHYSTERIEESRNNNNSTIGGKGEATNTTIVDDEF